VAVVIKGWVRGLSGEPVRLSGVPYAGRMSKQAADSLSASRLANLVAPAIRDAFDRYQGSFQQLTRRARGRFEQRDWKGAVADAIGRLDLYGTVIPELVGEVRSRLGARTADRLVWAGMKAIYSGLIAGRPDWELAETFFNSVTRRIFATAGVDQDIEYVDSDFDPPAAGTRQVRYRSYEGSGLARLVEAVLHDRWFDAPYEAATRDSRRAAEVLRAQLRAVGLAETDVTGAEILAAPFFRRKGAYLIGRLVFGSRSLPLVLALLNTDRGIVVDAVLTDAEDVSVLFSFTRSHFHVDLEPPYELVRYLKRLLPRKPVAELYIALGHHKHGKTELYRDLLRRLRETRDRFELAPGTPGTVMVVFTMPGYDVVLKVIKDHFPAEKSETAAAVRDKYRLVFRHDRAGRLVEAQEFEHLKFDLARLDPRLVEVFKSEADQTVTAGPDQMVVHHAYMERRVTPLDVFLQGADEDAARTAVFDFGQAVKDLAASGIFPGELLPKNFGVTRHGRIVCYDYDELGLLTDFRFRSIPEAQANDDDLSEGPWFGVGPWDVFPEEFRQFIGLPPGLLEVLDRHHGDLYEVHFWQEMQARVMEGEIIDVFPYPPSRQLAPPHPAT
jgi:isocitrate dehydrogenase kinase/phosphatase